MSLFFLRHTSNYFWWVSMCLDILEIEGDGDLIKMGIIQDILLLMERPWVFTIIIIFLPYWWLYCNKIFNLSQSSFVLCKHVIQHICNKKSALPRGSQWWLQGLARKWHVRQTCCMCVILFNLRVRNIRIKTSSRPGNLLLFCVHYVKEADSYHNVDLISSRILAFFGPSRLPTRLYKRMEEFFKVLKCIYKR